ncbi:O-antigen ligase domain-containing protein [Shewanella surugensis]|uniref:O-antigen ligase domain-containing protein n=1 Tax=Shewanella surugensis TaxID=212020 RepID=A0ABT0LB32_9GAMM|nr:O-antigen ligase domain-containing protein [Shewanella surugensis]MCL1124907.1 O-antigen ligase domain-containing protein [Shewanella surugensis]
MDPQTYTPENSDERLVWHSIIWTYAFWVIGAMYFVAPIIGWVLFLRMLKRIMVDKQSFTFSFANQCWCLGMLVMLLALVIGHLDYQLGIPKLIKSSIGWAKGWALIALFPLIGSLNIRPHIIYRATCIVCKHTIILMPFFFMAWILKLPATLYTSPLRILGGSGPEYFTVTLYEIDPSSGIPRWRLFTPWAPALGMVANLFYIFATQEKSKAYRWCGYVGSLLMILISQSRLALACYLILMAYFGLIRWYKSPYLYFIASPFVLIIGIFGVQFIEKIEQTLGAFKAARAGSTRVRKHLGDIAMQRWYNEAITWGHGIVEKGPHLVEFMPIGTHHTWYGLLFVKGIIGAISLTTPFIVSFITLICAIAYSTTIQVAFAFLIQLFLYTFGENLETLAYLYWPGLIILGIAHKEIAEKNQDDKSKSRK